MCIAIAACGSDGGGTADDEATGDGDGDETDNDDATDTDTGDPEDPRAEFCRERELPIAPLRVGESGEWGEVAGDFEVATTFGPWRLADNFSGCDTYLFINHSGDATSDALRGSFTADLFTRSPDNVHYFFLSSAGDPAQGAIDWQNKIGQTLAPLDEATQAYWSERVHFVEQDPSSIGGGVGELFANNPAVLAAAIDRDQRWDYANSTSDTGSGSFAQTGAVLAYTPRWYNFRHRQALELEAVSRDPSLTEVALLDEVSFPPDGPAGPDGPFANEYNYEVWSADFPAAAAMADYDTLEVVVTARCGPVGADDCGHWDYEAWVERCDDPNCEGERQEVIRWITPYARIGERQWRFEATPMLGLLQDGGEQFFRFAMRWNMNPSTWDIRFQLRNGDRGERPVETVTAFVGNHGFNGDYNSNWDTLEFTPPASASRVELVALITGHGQEQGNCAEWCNHQHEFTVNGGAPLVREFPGQVVAQRCAEAVDLGVIPGQWGNWTPGRAGWCPGLPVEPWVVDISEQVELGAVNTLDYRGMFGGQPVTESRGRILLSSYLVYYEAAP